MYVIYWTRSPHILPFFLHLSSAIKFLPYGILVDHYQHEVYNHPEMTPKERKHPEILKNSRKQRIARGSGTTAADINKLLNQYEQMKKMMKEMPAYMKKAKR